MQKSTWWKYPCVPSCTRGSATQRGLSLHQVSCKLSHEHDRITAQELSKKQRAAREAAKRAATARSLANRHKSHPPLPYPELMTIEDTDIFPPEPPSHHEDACSDPFAPPSEEPSLGRGRRTKRPTWKVLEQRISTHPALPPSNTTTPPSEAEETDPEFESRSTRLDRYGLYCKYLASSPVTSRTRFLPTPIHFVEPATRVPPRLRDSIQPVSSTATSPSSSIIKVLDSCSTRSAQLIMDWHWSTPTKSLEDTNKLVLQVIPLLKAEELSHFSAQAETRRIDAAIAELSDGWRDSPVNISVPDGNLHPPDGTHPVPVFTIHGLVHRPLIEIIKSVWTCSESAGFQYVPYREFWTRGKAGVHEQVYGELYTCEAFNDAYEDLQKQAPEPGCALERVICAMMLYSDSTHLANFGDAALWPLYLYFGNQSKYLPDGFHDWYTSITGEGPPADLLTHCRRELMHGVLRIILDDDFIQAYKHGIVLRCQDGILRRIFPRLFTYSADYPEKVLLATIRNLGKCPCPRCTVTKDRIKDIGTANDFARRVNLQRESDTTFLNNVKRARTAIYERGKGIKSAAVEAILAPRSYVPTTNAFNDRLGDLIKTFYLFVVDFMHEIEIGVWKALFIHIIRMLVAIGGTAIQLFNQRYRQIPTFGRSTIRYFHKNASAMKKLAARDFEDLLQCFLPVIEGLFPDPVHNRAIQDLVFTLAEWHANAKLRLHTASTVDILRQLTREYGIRLRHFATHICPSYDTRELPKEEAARVRRQAKQRTNRVGEGAPPKPSSTPKTARSFQLTTYKLHAMGDYVQQIVLFGSTDSYSTQPGELEHRSVKRYYSRTNKIQPTRQIARIHRRERILSKALTQRKEAREKAREKKSQKSINSHHYISPSRNFPVRLSGWLESHMQDARYKDFMSKLLNHLVARLRHPGMADDGTTYPAYDRAQVRIVSGRMFDHKTMQVNYTTYDMRRDYDIVNPNKHFDIMTVSPDFDPETRTATSGHPFRYGRVLGIYHADIVHVVPDLDASVHHVEFLWVQWYRYDSSFKAGFQHHRYHRLELIPVDDEAACGFIDPDDVIRGVHLIPAFAHGLMTPSGETSRTQDNNIWKYYYVNFLVDRDMYMRFRGGGIGHVVPVEVTEPPVDPDDVLDLESMESEGEDVRAAEEDMGVISEEEGDDEDNDDELDEEEEIDEEDHEDDIDKESEGEMDNEEDEPTGEENDGGIVDLMNDLLGFASL
ncbi:hypothetical protein QCA50_011932 [Cerrena zonata]|uniref:Uncharacterized protein n=1 Tax=Cerrena zonata TaxID=2478898 RepID=A0AAW0FV02_9APHY